MSNESIRGIRPGLEHEKARIDRIEVDELALRPELRIRKAEIVARLRSHHDRVAQLLHAYRNASGRDADRLSQLAYLAWRELRTSILVVQPPRGVSAHGGGSAAPTEGRPGPPTMRCFSGATLDTFQPTRRIPAG